jgi:hypothetical protein
MIQSHTSRIVLILILLHLSMTSHHCEGVERSTNWKSAFDLVAAGLGNTSVGLTQPGPRVHSGEVGVPWIVVLVTDGMPSTAESVERTFEVANYLKEIGATVIVLQVNGAIARLCGSGMVCSLEGIARVLLDGVCLLA